MSQKKPQSRSIENALRVKSGCITITTEYPKGKSQYSSLSYLTDLNDEELQQKLRFFFGIRTAIAFNAFHREVRH